eukprot:6491458-Amphidinium_carterae.1
MSVPTGRNSSENLPKALLQTNAPHLKARKGSGLKASCTPKASEINYHYIQQQNNGRLQE